jgi:glycosyltransferase involved in cell wall biosynthesis
MPKGRATICHVLHSLSVGGAEMMAVEVARELTGAYRFVFTCLDDLGHLAEGLSRNGAAVHVLDRRPGLDGCCVRKLASILRLERVNLVHAHQYTPFFYAAFASLLGKPRPRLILTEHGRHYPDRVSRLRRAVNRAFLDRQANAITAVSKACAKSLTQVDGFGGARIQVIENGVRLAAEASAEDRKVLRQRLGLQADRHYVVNVARHHPIKDQATLLRAFQQVAAVRCDVDLLMVGTGVLSTDLQTLCRELAISDRVRFLGMRRDVPDILRSADVFVSTSLYEAAPLTVLEAMAASLAVVVTSVGGNPELLRHQVEGLLVKPRDVAGIAAAIRTLLDAPDLASAMGQAGATRVSERYRLERVIERYDGLYRRLAHCA